MGFNHWYKIHGMLCRWSLYPISRSENIIYTYIFNKRILSLFSYFRIIVQIVWMMTFSGWWTTYTDELCVYDVITGKKIVDLFYLKHFIHILNKWDYVVDIQLKAYFLICQSINLMNPVKESDDKKCYISKWSAINLIIPFFKFHV